MDGNGFEILAFVWAGLIAFAVLAYVVLDGFDLGIGILFPFLEKGGERDLAMNTVAPIWDGNETWLVLGGGGLFAVFPLAYAVVMPALYVPILAMLAGLIFRGVAFEYRWRAGEGQWFWDWAFTLGSGLAALMQGIALGALVQGIEMDGRAYGGGRWDWLTPFTILTGVSVLVGYTLLGACWLIMKTEGPVRDLAMRAARLTGIATLVLIGAVSLATPFLHPVYLGRWFSWSPSVAFTLIVPLLVAAAAWMLFTALTQGRDAMPFIAALGLFVLGYAGVGVSFYPYIVPHDLTIWQAAAPKESLAFTLVGAAVLIPMILIYTGYAYWVFRGKVNPDEGYH
ncbi:cytochrome d ubiquinol oxidase subunit II [Mesobaculum littorinae]|uniref:Cytochrome d ubiquinol oxidase subunit II n=1 Tax=Mesobaculum littorinae TaxID=2486419 RepID=A0A438AJ82_9RHOB|nr:cytochrome d ubiquinol oxidase subunit II [Mesobaculum littorinae]RVV98719.1 cytochrome d ubiquinol oxidase subunit II [Mesobaculum littorinae]